MLISILVRTQNREISFRCIAYNSHRLTSLGDVGATFGGAINCALAADIENIPVVTKMIAAAAATTILGFVGYLLVILLVSRHYW